MRHYDIPFNDRPFNTHREVFDQFKKGKSILGI